MSSNRLEHEETKSRLAALGEISAGIAHEIRNPLTSVKGFLQLMKKDVSHKYWDLVFSELDQAITTVQEFLTVSKPNQDTESAAVYPLCVDIEAILSLFHNETYRVQVVKRLYNTDVTIFGKRQKIKKALFNLLKNAFEAIEGNGTITVEHFVEGDSVVVSISDTGKGISRDKLALLGTPFFTTKAEGTGLGLAFAYATFYEQGGEVHVESELDQGTTFTITMPVSGAKTNEAADFNLTYTPGQDVRAFFEGNRETFNRQLAEQASTTWQIVSKSKSVTTQDLVDHANQIMNLIHDGLTQEIIQLAQERGIAWAKSDVPIISKMEWFYALRKVIWNFLRYYHLQAGITEAEVFELSDRINDALDNFIIHFNVSFTKFRDDILRSQEAIIDELSVPVIPIQNGVAVFPVIGNLDENRIHRMEDRLFEQVETLGIRKLYIDLSSAAFSDPPRPKALNRIFDGVAMLGCQSVVTGIRAHMARVMLDLGESLLTKVTIEGTLQQALEKELELKV